MGSIDARHRGHQEQKGQTTRIQDERLLIVVRMTSHARFQLEEKPEGFLLRLASAHGTNQLHREFVLRLTEAVKKLGKKNLPLVITGNENFFSAGADLNEITALNGPSGFEFSKMGQTLMNLVENFPAPVVAAISGYCMGGGLDLALACRYRIASPGAIFGHRGAALGVITGWGGTQRLPRLIGQGRALELLVTAKTITAAEALREGLVDQVSNDPVNVAWEFITKRLGESHTER
jgi:enoyl-CoA hydratase